MLFKLHLLLLYLSTSIFAPVDYDPILETQKKEISK